MNAFTTKTIVTQKPIARWRARRQNARCIAADEESRHDDCQHSGNFEMIRRQVRQIRGHQRDDRLQLVIARKMPRDNDDRAGRKSDRRCRDDRDHELLERLTDRKNLSEDRADRNRVNDQRRRVVDQTFAFDRRDEMPRYAQLIGEAREGDLIGRGDDRAQDQRCRPPYARIDFMRDERDRHGRSDDQSESQLEDPCRACAKAAGRGRDAFPIKQRR